MNSGNDIIEELNQMGSQLSALPRTMPFAVPDGYFNDFSNIISASFGLAAMESASPGWNRSNPFSVPASYFNELTESIVNEVITNDTSSKLTKHLPYSTPPDYFRQLPAQLLAAAKAGDKPARKTKVIKLNGPGIFKRVQWAAAAIFILFVGLGSYIAFFSTDNHNPENLLALVPNNEINEYLMQDYRINPDRLFSNTAINNLQLDNKEIIQYLNETGWDAAE